MTYKCKSTFESEMHNLRHNYYPPILDINKNITNKMLIIIIIIYV